MTAAEQSSRTGFFQAVGAYFLWGFMPLFFKQLQSISALEVVSHRIIWSVGLLLIILWIRGQMAGFRKVITTLATLKLMFLSAILIATNWLVYIWAVNNDQILAASLGYYLNPLVNVVLGFFFLKERLGPIQILAVILAAIGVSVLAFESLDTLWISFALALSFSFYGLVRKMAPVASLEGLATETMLLLPVALGYAIWIYIYGNAPTFGSNTRTDIFLIMGGAVTAAPLLLFAAATKKLRYATIGFIQYIGPTIQFLLAIFLYEETLTTAHVICFSLIWLGLALYSGEAYMQSKREKAMPA